MPKQDQTITPADNESLNAQDSANSAPTPKAPTADSTPKDFVHTFDFSTLDMSKEQDFVKPFKDVKRFLSVLFGIENFKLNKFDWGSLVIVENQTVKERVYNQFKKIDEESEKKGGEKLSLEEYKSLYPVFLRDNGVAMVTASLLSGSTVEVFPPDILGKLPNAPLAIQAKGKVTNLGKLRSLCKLDSSIQQTTPSARQQVQDNYAKLMQDFHPIVGAELNEKLEKHFNGSIPDSPYADPRLAAAITMCMMAPNQDIELDPQQEKKLADDAFKMYIKCAYDGMDPAQGRWGRTVEERIADLNTLADIFKEGCSITDKHLKEFDAAIEKNYTPDINTLLAYRNGKIIFDYAKTIDVKLNEDFRNFLSYISPQGIATQQKTDTTMPIQKEAPKKSGPAMGK